MKPAPFNYFAPETLDEAVAIKASLGSSAKILAGGQSLVPSMAFRLARPSALIDINGIAASATATRTESGMSIGPLVRHAFFERPHDDNPTAVLFSAASRHIGHLPIRTRGTFLGSIAHADPAAEWGVVALATDAVFRAVDTSGERSIEASDFFLGPYMTQLRDDEVLAEAFVPELPVGSRVSFLELSRRSGDFALICVGVTGRIVNAKLEAVRIAVGGVSTSPVRTTNAENLLTGASPDSDAFRAAGAEARNETYTIGDIHGSADYRSKLVEVFVRRALDDAFGSAARS
jgi:carbon-monoxide dehydrogenase medium subunit